MAVSEAIKLSKNLSYGTIWLIWAGAEPGINSNQLKLPCNISSRLTDSRACTVDCLTYDLKKTINMSSINKIPPISNYYARSRQNCDLWCLSIAWCSTG